MIARTVLALVAALAALAPAGCRKAASPQPSAQFGGLPPTNTSVAPAPAAAATDYRTLSKAELEALIRSKTGQEVTLAPSGPNRYTGTITAPGGTALPVVVTVEAERIVCETKVGDSSTRQIITPRGLQSDLNMK
jgi:hypothetical protein